MTWSNRLRLFVGLIVVVVIVLGFTLILSQRETEVQSRTAAVTAITYPVGSDYAGTVTNQDVNQGDAVKTGQPLITIQSATLAAALAAKTKVPTSSAYTVSAPGMLTLLATQPGIVSTIGAHVGGFVSAGSALATIDRSGSLFVLADFSLDPYDFSRIQKGARVDLILPNQEQLSGTVARISVTTVGGKADAAIEVRSAQLVRGTHSGLVMPGTPISAILHLRADGPLGGLRQEFVSLLAKLGL